jgi:hypothetical protein
MHLTLIFTGEICWYTLSDYHCSFSLQILCPDNKRINPDFISSCFLPDLSCAMYLVSEEHMTTSVTVASWVPERFAFLVGNLRIQYGFSVISYWKMGWDKVVKKKMGIGMPTCEDRRQNAHHFVPDFAAKLAVWYRALPPLGAGLTPVI